MRRNILFIADQERTETCARMLEQQVQATVEIASDRRSALVALRRDFVLIIVEEALVEGDPDWADQVWESAGLAITLQVNFGISGCSRLIRDVKAALLRRSAEEALARRVVWSEVESDLKSALTGLMLESELALQEPAIPLGLEQKLRHMAELAGLIRERLRGAQAERSGGTLRPA